MCDESGHTCGCSESIQRFKDPGTTIKSYISNKLIGKSQHLASYVSRHIMPWPMTWPSCCPVVRWCVCWYPCWCVGRHTLWNVGQCPCQSVGWCPGWLLDGWMQPIICAALQLFTSRIMGKGTRERPCPPPPLGMSQIFGRDRPNTWQPPLACCLYHLTDGGMVVLLAASIVLGHQCHHRR